MLAKAAALFGIAAKVNTLNLANDHQCLVTSESPLNDQYYVDSTVDVST